MIERTENNTMLRMIGFDTIQEMLEEYANTKRAKEMAKQLKPYLVETELRKNLRETTQAKWLLENVGTPPLPNMDGVEENLEKIVRGVLLLPEDIELIGIFLSAIKRLKSYLEKGKEKQIGLAFYSDSLHVQDELCKEIERCIRGKRVDDAASGTLQDIRRKLIRLDEKRKEKAESILKSCKAYTAEAFLVSRNGRICIPIKKAYKSKVSGTVVDKSSTGETLFIEPKAVEQLCAEYELCKVDEDTEERRILYTLMALIEEKSEELFESVRVISNLDFVFAKGKMSIDMEGVEPEINFERYIKLEKARHPLLKKEDCVPLSFELGNRTRGMVITGPNTGGKTVAIKTVALLSAMGCSGLHVPCSVAKLAVNSQILCDIGDGQNIKDNLSTFSAHITNVIEILKRVNKESLVILDELGSGTDPAEGMGIAVAVLEQLRLSGCLFLVTTHYPEVKEYAGKHEEIVNARMAFDRESLRPLYRLEMGKVGESCALYIAKRLGVPGAMLRMAALEAYGSRSESIIEELELREDEIFQKIQAPALLRNRDVKREAVHGEGFQRGDSVIVLTSGRIGIVVKPADSHGNVLVQVAKEKFEINHKRLKLKVAASQLYPEDYDFSILFDTVENRKARHKMEKGHQENLVIYSEE